MYVASHQPDLAPWTGLFCKLYKSDMFIFELGDYMNRDSYSRKVKLSDKVSLTLPIQKYSSSDLIPYSKIIIDKDPLKQKKFFNTLNGHFLSKRLSKVQKSRLADINDIFSTAFSECDDAGHFNLTIIRSLLKFINDGDQLNKIEYVTTPYENGVTTCQRVMNSLDQFVGKSYTYLTGPGLEDYKDETLNREYDLITISSDDGSHKYSILNYMIENPEITNILELMNLHGVKIDIE